MIRPAALLILAALAACTVRVADSPNPPPQGKPEPGLTEALARERAGRVGEVRYRLSFRLEAGLEEVAGAGELRFTLRDAVRPLILDFGGSGLDALEVNGKAADPAALAVADHLVLPPALLREGENRVRARFRSPVAATGTPLTVYRGPGGGEWLYTLLVPAEAHRLFPCFDQPDLKARFALELEVPGAWEAVANAPRAAVEDLPGGRRRWTFRDTPLLPTYLFAFAAGPFAVVEDPAGSAPPLRLFLRPEKAEALEAEALFARHRRALARLGERFQTPYPFRKLDLVLLPGFPYGGMEHAGAIFYRESALVFDHEPDAGEVFRRDALILHEVAHQWFGNLVTMRWFDDLWLKEGFATFLAFHLLDGLAPATRPWLRFHEETMPPALRVDVTPGTVPVYQELPNLADAKANYGPIVYDKAPAVLRELHARLGDEAFFAGVAGWLREHAWGNATWRDLLRSLEAGSGRDLEAWARAWLLTPGVPTVRLLPAVEGGRLERLELRQDGPFGPGRWPLELELLLAGPDGRPRLLRVATDRPRAEVPGARGLPAPAWILPDPRGLSYARFVLDPASAAALLEALPGLSDPLERAVAFTALVETSREAELDPAALARLCLRLLDSEEDPLTCRRILGVLGTCLERWLAPPRAAPLRAAAEEQLRAAWAAGALGERRLATLRFLARHGRDPATLDLLAGLARRGEGGGLRLGAEDRFLCAAALLAAGRPGAGELLDRLAAELPGDVAKHAWVARAAAPDPEVKAAYFAAWLQEGEPPEQWIQASLATFHWPGQEALTRPFLAPALERLLWVKEHRRIFFLPAWLDAFLGAHASPGALGTAEAFLAGHPDLPQDVRRKFLQSLDGLRRAVRIRRRFSGGGEASPGAGG